MKTITCTAKVSKSTHVELRKFLAQQRDLWNAGLTERIEAYKRHKRYGSKNNVSRFSQHKELTHVRHGMPDEFGQYHVKCQRSSLDRLDKAFQNFFCRVRAGEKPGFPRFKGKNRKIHSFDIPYPFIKRINKRHVLIVKGVGKFRFKASQEIGQVNAARVVVTPCRIKVQLIVETPECDYQDQREPIGIDLGIAQQATLSDGTQFPKRILDETRKKRLQRKLSRSARGSRNRGKKRLAHAKECQRIKERERSYIHELTAHLVKNFSSKFCIENLQIKNMVKNPKLSKSILEQNWGLLGTLLTYKAENAGGWVVKVNPRNTSQRCSCCGAMPESKLTLSDRTYICMACGLVEDRDVNAARNVLQGGNAAHSGGIPEASGEGRSQLGSGLVEGAEQYAFVS